MARITKNATDLLINAATDQQLDLLRVAASLNKDVAKLLEQLEADIIAQINRYAGKSALTAARLRDLLSSTYKAIAEAYQGAEKALAIDLPKVIDASSKVTVNSINDVATTNVAAVSFTLKEIKSMATENFILGRRSEEWWAKQSVGLQEKFTVQMRLGMLQGEGVPELVRRVRGTKAAGYSDGIMKASTTNAAAIVRTSVISQANTGRLATYIANRDLISSIQWVATLDNRTTEICMALDGLMWELPESDDPEDYGNYKPVGHDKQFPGPTAHWSCRSTQVSVLKPLIDLAEEAGVPKGELPDALDGRPGQRRTYKDWLDAKSNEEQDAILGKTKAELYRKGDLELSDLTDQSNRPLTADALLTKYG